MNTVRFSVVLFSIRDKTDDYSCIFCDFRTFEKNKHDDHLCSNHKHELKENYFELTIRGLTEHIGTELSKSHLYIAKEDDGNGCDFLENTNSAVRKY